MTISWNSFCSISLLAVTPGYRGCIVDHFLKVRVSAFAALKRQRSCLAAVLFSSRSVSCRDEIKRIFLNPLLNSSKILVEAIIIAISTTTEAIIITTTEAIVVIILGTSTEATARFLFLLHFLLLLLLLLSLLFL